MKHEFKVGDWVYYPEKTNKSVQLKEWILPKNAPIICALYLAVNGYCYVFKKDGLRSCAFGNPTIFPATEKNCKLLSELHDVEFEKPPLRGSELTRKLLDSGWDSVACWVGDKSDEEAIELKHKKLISHSVEANFGNSSNEWFSCAVPFDPRTGEEMTEEVLGD